MTLRLYMDVHVDGRVVRALSSRGVDVMRAQDDGADTFPDPELRDRATVLQRVVVTFDDDFLTEATHRQRTNRDFSGLIFVSPAGMSPGELSDELQIVAECMTIAEITNRIVFIPL